jgi:hypothetical protein
MLKALLEPYRKLTSHLKWSFGFWKNTLVTGLQNLKLLGTRTDRQRVNINLKPYLLILYALVSVPVIQLNHKEFSSLRKFQADLSVIPTGSVVLTHFNLQYKILYVRPDLRIIPSCEMGFAKNCIRKEYLQFMNEGEVLPLARKTNARFLLEPKGMYINPQNGKSLRIVKKGKNLKIWKVLHLSE